MYNVLISFVLSIIVYFICLKELNRKTENGAMYPDIKEGDKKLILLYLIIFVLLFCTQGTSSIFALSFGAITPILITQIIIDIREKELSDLLTLVIAVASMIPIIRFIIIKGYNPIILTYFENGIILFAVYLLIAIISRGSLGGGDIKMIGALGLFFPTDYTCSLLIIPFLIGSIYAVIMLISKKKEYKENFAFGPSIILGVLAIIFFL